VIKIVVFDMDGVLCRYRIERRLARLAAWSRQSPEAFRRLATRLKVAPDEILYFDDDATYVAGAREAGLSAHRVGGAAGVRAGLAVHGLGRW
jgi:FMN phosphatase YigB (HAD superfamily)